jgi:hypothetical protein
LAIHVDFVRRPVLRHIVVHLNGNAANFRLFFPQFGFSRVCDENCVALPVCFRFSR